MRRAMVLVIGVGFAVVFPSGMGECAEASGRPLEIGNGLQLLWDDAVVDSSGTTVSRMLHQPQFEGEVMELDAPWEKCISYFHVVHVPGGVAKPYRMYYLAGGMNPRGKFWPYGRSVCFIESADGIEWARPTLNLVEFNGSKANNIITNERMLFGALDNFFVFYDENPDCPADERFKGVANFEFKYNPDGSVKSEHCSYHGLECFVSSDGISFRHRGYLVREGLFDSLNVAFWHAPTREYRLYFRSGHTNLSDRNGDAWVRDVRYTTSKDFTAWAQPRLLDFLPDADGEPAVDYPLYTNGMMPYPRAPEVCIGLPTRYVERRKWTSNYDRLPSPDARRARMDKKNGGSARFGLALTDCVFMMTRDGGAFRREDEAFLRPGPEHAGNWVYGDGYPAVGLVPTKDRYGNDPVYSIYVPQASAHTPGRHFLKRYTIRQDGFVSRHATFREQRLVTRKFVCPGGGLFINFSTSARGYVYLTIRGEDGRELHSTELFGDKVDRLVGFVDGTPDDFIGRPVLLDFRMSDADVYSYCFK